MEVRRKVLTGRDKDGNKYILYPETGMVDYTLYRNKSYEVGDIAYHPALPSWAYLECVTAGITGETEIEIKEEVVEE